MSQHKATVEYLRNCYQADNRELGLSDFYSEKVEHRWLLTESSLFTDNLPIYPVDPGWGEAVEKTLSIYQKEKELMLSYLFLTGELSVGNRVSKVVTPLFLIPTTLEKRATLEKRDEDYFVKPMTEMASVNPSALTLLSSLDNNGSDITE